MTNTKKTTQTSPKNDKRKVNERADFVGYVTLSLSEDDKLLFDGWYADETNAHDAMLDALGLGYQLSLKQDYENETFVCSISNWRVGRTDAGVIYTARSGYPMTAFWKALFVWSEKLHRNLANGFVSGGNRDSF